jgi:hypothetical protein
MKLVRLLPVAVIVAVVSASFVMMPQSPQVLPSNGMRAAVRGAMHIHTRRSDGTGTVDQIAAAAARAGLSFVILTDHGDATREPERPSYQHGVLCIDAVEISTDDGHVVALGLPRSPYPLGGEARDVVEDVARMGGMSIAAHPTSAKPALSWRDWSIPVNGLEWLNGDSEWRDEPFRTLGRALLTYPVRRAAALAALLDRPEEALSRWDRAAASRPVVGLAGSDAHARIGLRGEGDPFEPRIALHVPGYEQVFRTFSIAVMDVSLTRDAVADAKSIVDAIRRGHVFSSIDGLAGPARVSFTADAGGRHAQMGDTVLGGAPVTFHIESNAPANSRAFLVKDGVHSAEWTNARQDFTIMETGVYRVEVHVPDAPGRPPIPWIVTNPIYVRTETRPAVEQGSATTFTPRYQDQSAEGWMVEKNAQSQGAIDVVNTLTGKQLKLRFALGGADADSPFVGFAMPAGPIDGSDRIVFTAMASRPMRMSVQLRAPGEPVDRRWRRSVFVDEMLRSFTIRFDDMRALGSSSTTHPALGGVRDVLFVIDGTNARPGSNGQIWLDDVKYGR